MEDFSAAMYDDGNAVMEDRLYDMDGEEVDDIYNGTSQSYSYYHNAVDIVDYVFPKCDLQHRVE